MIQIDQSLTIKMEILNFGFNLPKIGQIQRKVKERETDRQRERQRDRQTDRETDRQTDRQRET